MDSEHRDSRGRGLLGQRPSRQHPQRPVLRGQHEGPERNPDSGRSVTGGKMGSECQVILDPWQRM